MPRYYDDDDRDDDDFDIGRIRRRVPEHDGPMSQSGLGVASLIISIVCAIALFALIVVATIKVTNQNGPVNDNDPIMGIVGLGILAGLGFALIGVVIGIVGSIQPDRGKLCGILGSIFNGLILLGVGSLMCLGLAVG